MNKVKILARTSLNQRIRMADRNYNSFKKTLKQGVHVKCYLHGESRVKNLKNFHRES